MPHTPCQDHHCRSRKPCNSRTGWECRPQRRSRQEQMVRFEGDRRRDKELQSRMPQPAWFGLLWLWLKSITASSEKVDMKPKRGEDGLAED
jgi:hypothetical protein